MIPRHRHVRLARAPRRMGRALSGQQRERRQAAERTRPEGQPGAPEGPRRVRARRLPNQGLPVPQPLPRPQGEEELQAGRLRHRPQAGPRDPCGPEEPGACTDPGTDCREIMARRNAPRWIRMMKDCGIEQPDRRRHSRPDASRALRNGIASGPQRGPPATAIPARGAKARRRRSILAQPGNGRSVPNDGDVSCQIWTTPPLQPRIRRRSGSAEFRPSSSRRSRGGTQS